MTISRAPDQSTSTISGAWRVAPAILALAVAAWIVARELEAIDLGHLIRTMRSLPAAAVFASLVFSIASYGCLGLQEVYGLLILRRRLPTRRVVANATIANALAGVVGFGLATGTLLRLKLYRGSRLRARSIAKLNVLMSLANYLGGLAILGLGVVARPTPIAKALHWPVQCIVLAGAALLAPAGASLAIWRRRQRSVATSQRLGALAASTGDWIFSGAALFVVSGRSLAEFPTFLAVFCFGSLSGSLVGVPTGLGVLDAAMLSLQGGDRVDKMAAGLIIYRAVYYAGPALCAATALGLVQAAEILRRGRPLRRGTAAKRRSPQQGGEDIGGAASTRHEPDSAPLDVSQSSEDGDAAHV